MTDLLLPRRKFLIGLAGIIAAPAVVKASSLMHVRSMELPLPELIDPELVKCVYRIVPTAEWRQINCGVTIRAVFHPSADRRFNLKTNNLGMSAVHNTSQDRDWPWRSIPVKVADAH